MLISSVFVHMFGSVYISTCDSVNGWYWERKTCILSVRQVASVLTVSRFAGWMLVVAQPAVIPFLVCKPFCQPSNRPADCVCISSVSFAVDMGRHRTDRFNAIHAAAWGSHRLRDPKRVVTFQIFCQINF
jgi:hypothetical protein